MIPIIVCSGTPQPRAVVYGYVETLPEDGKPVLLHQARMVLRWDVHGLFGLASIGPVGDTKLTPAVEQVEDRLVQQWLRVAPEAAVKLDAWDK